MDKFYNVYDDVDWESGGKGLYMHADCYLIFKTQRRLEQAKKRKSKADEKCQLEEQENECSSEKGSSAKKLRSSTGPLHDKNKCVFCMTGKSKKKGYKYTMNTLSTLDVWDNFKAASTLLEDMNKREN